MTGTVFLDRDRYWKEIKSRVPVATTVMAAIAYFGKGGADYLPLRSGDRLVVDLSRGAVKQGVSDPREIKRLIERGVEVFTRESLHAKAIVIDDVAIAGSANVSQNARRYLGEAAILSTLPSAVRAAKRFVGEMCSEPVLDRYLEECIALYQPPVFKASKTARRAKQGSTLAKLWYIAGLEYIDPKDQNEIKPLEQEAANDLLDPRHSKVDSIPFTARPSWFSDIRPNNWIISCTWASKRTRDIGFPARVIGTRQYRKAGKTRYLLVLESPVDGETMSLTDFSKRWRQIAPKGKRPPKRTQAIGDEMLADAVLRFWTPRGRVAKRRSK
jgi:hypothetical protein